MCAEADIGLFEERLSEITHNRAMATKAKMEALEKMIDVIGKYGEIEAMLKMNQLESIEINQQQNEDKEKVDAKRTAFANESGQQQKRAYQEVEKQSCGRCGPLKYSRDRQERTESSDIRQGCAGYE